MALDLIAELEAVVDLFGEEEIPYALPGALALAVHGFVRATRDIDIMIPPDHWDRARSAVGRLGYSLMAGPMTFGADTPRERQLRRISKAHPASKPVLTSDFLLVSPVLEGAWAERVWVEWRSRKIAVVSRAGLVEMKRLAGRPQDLVDVDKLESADEG